jgi:hypothetical protein
VVVVLMAVPHDSGNLWLVFTGDVERIHALLPSSLVFYQSRFSALRDESQVRCLPIFGLGSTCDVYHVCRGDEAMRAADSS